MKVKTSDLTGAALDWAVATAEGRKDIRILLSHGVPIVVLRDRFNYAHPGNEVFAPHKWWRDGGPIIEREGITIDARESHWMARIWAEAKGDFIEVGRRGALCATPLQAAMRCFVASKMGDEIELPKELT